ncbi:MAG: hypothetical protein K2N25_02670 [Muribaculaceae bacterium]|nr:hypothetical protein [Muribaculaceae bacterium]
MAVARRQASYLQHDSPYAPAVVLTVRLMKRDEALPEWVASDLSGEQTVREEEEPGLWQYVMVLFPWLGELSLKKLSAISCQLSAGWEACCSIGDGTGRAVRHHAPVRKGHPKIKD